MKQLPKIHESRLVEPRYKIEQMDLEFANGERRTYERIHGSGRPVVEVNQLLKQFDTLRKELDHNGALAGADAHTERAMNVLLSSKLLDALDVSKEDPKIRDRYGDGKPYQYQYDGAPTANDQLLMARRLVQAGARCVSLSFGRWDSHGKNFDLVRDHGSKLDRGLTALVEDLERLDMLDDVTVIAWGEFGRTPRINNGAGRDHWPQVSCAIMAGGGLKTGQVIGSTNRLGEHAKDRPVTFGEIFATLYHSLGLNPETTTVMDPTGRPQHLAAPGRLPGLPDDPEHHPGNPVAGLGDHLRRRNGLWAVRRRGRAGHRPDRRAR